MEDKRIIPELLAPAGEPKAFYAALAGGADAIYCALGNDFNARRMADNFTPETFERACRDAHLAGARVYVTINIVIQDDEMERALATVVQAWGLGADAFIKRLPNGYDTPISDNGGNTLYQIKTEKQASHFVLADEALVSGNSYTVAVNGTDKATVTAQ